MTEPFNRNAIARLMDRLGTMADDLTARLAAADDALAQLRGVASTAAGAIAASAADRLQLNDRLAVLEKTQPAFGTGATPTIALLGGSADVVVTLSSTMPSTTYNVVPIVAPALVGKLTATVKTKTTTSITVTVQSLLASVAAGSLTVIAWQPTPSS